MKPIEPTIQKKEEGSTQVKARGFTLTEVVIVLGIVGIIISAIWTAASTIYSNVRTTSAQKTILSTSQNIRSLFATSRATTGQSALTSIIGPGMLPSDYMTNAGIYVNPWNLKATANTTFIYGLNNTFGIEMDAISANACAALAVAYGSNTSLTGGGNIMGLVGVTTSSAASSPGTPIINAIPTSWVNGTTALCGASSSNTSNIVIGFDMTKM